MQFWNLFNTYNGYVYETRFLNIDTHSCGWRTVGSVGTYIVALCIIYILKKIPIIKKIVP